MTSKSMTPSTEPALLSPEKWSPHAYQKRALKFLLQHGAAGLFLPPGLGKTTIVLAALKLLFKEKQISKVLVVAPLRVCFSTWPGEIQKWADFNHLRVQVLHGDEGNKDELLENDADIYVVNPEGLDWLLRTEKTKDKKGKTKVTLDVRRFKKLGFDVLILDELTKFKNHSSDRWKAMKMVLGTFGRRWGLTGSPAANGLEQLFGQMFMLDQGRSLGSYITHYRRDFFEPSHDGFGWNLRLGMEEKIYERVSPVVLRVSEQDAGIDLPELVMHDIWVELPPDAMAVYLAMEDDLVAQLESGAVTAKNTGVAMGKCSQIANGSIYKDAEVEALVRLPKTKGGREWVAIHDQKFQALADLHESLQGNPLLCTYEFGHDLERLKKGFPDSRFVADYPPGKFKAMIEDPWNAGDLSEVFAQSTSISHGLNLQKKGHHIAMLGVPWDYEAYDQVIRRVLRQGNSNKRVFLHRILARGTVDHIRVAALSRKGKDQESFFAALVKLRKSRRK